MLTVACVLKAGGLYDSKWVARLQAMVAKHLPIEHRFVCLSDVDVPCERIPLEHNWPGWWSKIELFKLRGPVLDFDLDTAIVGDLTDIAATAERCAFVVLRDFYRLGKAVGSGVMAWNGDAQMHGLDVRDFYSAFADDPEGWQRKIGRRGDQGFLEEFTALSLCDRWQDEVGEQIVSYKVHCQGGVVPWSARVVCLHGQPKFRDMPVGDPVRMAWEQAA